MSSEDMKEYYVGDLNYIHKCKEYINLMLRGQQWSGINKADVDKWLMNFKDATDEEYCIIYKLLSRLIYFSEKDVEELLRDMVINGLFSDILLEEQKKSDFQLSQKALQNILAKEIASTCFVPLLDSDSPHESGNYVNRLLVQKQIIPSEQSFFLNKLIYNIENRGYKRLVIVDDCIGSGQQITSFWLDATVVDRNKKTWFLQDWLKENEIETFYLSLFGYKKTVDSLKVSLDGINVCCAISLGSELRVFERESYMWDSEEEYIYACNFLKRVTMENGIELKGYQGLDFAFIMHQTIPDWSLPLFWRDTADWKCLLRRKNSSV